VYRPPGGRNQHFEGPKAAGLGPQVDIEPETPRCSAPRRVCTPSRRRGTRRGRRKFRFPDLFANPSRGPIPGPGRIRIRRGTPSETPDFGRIGNWGFPPGLPAKDSDFGNRGTFDSEKRPGPGARGFGACLLHEDEAQDEEPAVQVCTQVSDDRDGPSQHRPDHRFPKMSRTAGDDHAVAGLYGFY
jgi:hypothetical protein